VLLDFVALAGGTFTPSLVQWNPETVTFSTTAGSHTLTFQGKVDSNDDSAFIDKVSLVGSAPPVPEPGSLALLGTVVLGTLRLLAAKSKAIK
jgi:hypothetical protein